MNFTINKKSHANGNSFSYFVRIKIDGQPPIRIVYKSPQNYSFYLENAYLKMTIGDVSYRTGTIGYATDVSHLLKNAVDAIKAGSITIDNLLSIVAFFVTKHTILLSMHQAHQNKLKTLNEMQKKLLEKSVLPDRLI
jgi:hypothetical protein